MERLTERNDKGQSMCIKCGDNCEHYLMCMSEDFSNCPYMDNVIEKLCIYEDTKITPEQIGDIKYALEYEQLNIYKLFKGLDEYREYKDLEEQGLLIKLPCEVGDTLYGIMLNELKEYRVFAINIGLRKHGNSCVVLANNHRDAVVDFELIDFGKTVFLTREEAEKELERLNKLEVEM